MKLKVTAGGIPAGAYHARLTGVVGVEADQLRGYGEGLRWEFEVVAGPLTGRKTSRITTATPTMKNSCGKVLSGLLGRPLADNEDIEIEQLLGKVYMVVVGTTESGATRVETVAPPPA